jgi:hypothetical protein
MSFLPRYCTRPTATDNARKTASPTTAVDAANVEAIRRILAASTVAGGAGVLAAGAMNLGALTGQPQSVLPSTEPVTVKLIDESPTANRPWHGLRPAKPLPWITMSGQRTKLGQAPATPPSTMQTVAQGLYDNVIKPTGLHQFADPGLPTTSANSKLWGVPGMAAAGALSFVGGLTATDWLLKRRRDAGMEREVESAEKDYLAALSQLSTAGRKTAEKVDATAGKAVAEAAPSLLKQLYDAGAQIKPDAAATAAAPAISRGIEPIKAFGGWGQQANNAASGLGAWWTALATVPAIPAGMGMYSFMRDSGERKALQEAIALRRRMRQHTAPPAIQLVPQG